MSIAFPANTSLRVNTPCSDLPLFRYSYLFMPPLGVAYKPVWYFITSIFTLPHIPRRFTVMTFLPYHALDSYTRLFVCCFTSYPHHRQFIDLRHIGHTIHLWTAFDNLMFRCLSADFNELRTYSVLHRLCTS